MKQLVTLLALALFSFSAYALETSRPSYSADFILRRVLEFKNLSYRSDVPMPEVIHSSEAKVKDFQDDVEPQWGLRPDAITNVFVLAKNRIYVLDDKTYYDEQKRCIDDSLAHELAHYVQVKYRNWDLNDESLEWDAVETQNWFRSKYCPGL